MSILEKVLKDSSTERHWIPIGETSSEFTYSNGIKPSYYSWSREVKYVDRVLELRYSNSTNICLDWIKA